MLTLLFTFCTTTWTFSILHIVFGYFWLHIAFCITNILQVCFNIKKNCYLLTHFLDNLNTEIYIEQMIYLTVDRDYTY